MQRGKKVISRKGTDNGAKRLGKVCKGVENKRQRY